MTAEPGSSGVLTVPPESASVRAARRFVATALQDVGLPADTVDTAVLLTSELVTNSVLHASTAIEVRVRTGLDILVEVRDASPRVPRRRAHGEESVTGRGLDLVEMLADSYGSTQIPGAGKSVWFTLGDSGAPGSASSWGEVEPVAGPVLTVVLRHLPVVLYDVMREHNEALMRDYTLYRLDRPGDDGSRLPQIAAADRARLRVVAAFLDFRAALPEGVAVPAHIDLSLPVSPDQEGEYALLAPVIRHAERLASAGRLLTRPALPEIAALHDWMSGQVLLQLRGGAPAPWHLDGEAAGGDAAPVPYDSGWVRRTGAPVIVGDDTNRILAVSAAAARALGWEPDQLVGRRLTTLIPAHLRDAHIAGFTRQLVTGRSRLLDAEVELPALRADGTQVPLRITLTKQAVGDRAVFVAWIRA